MRQLTTVLLFFIILFSTGCRWNLQNRALVPLRIKKIIFDSKDPNHFLIRAIRKQFRLNHIEVVKKKSFDQVVPSFVLMNSSLKSDIDFAIHDGGIVQRRIILSVSAKVFFPNKSTYQISTKVCRLFLDHFHNSLAKRAEQELLINEMYDSAAEQLVCKLFHLPLRLLQDAKTEHSTTSYLHNSLTSR